MELRVLGPLEVVVDGEPIDLGAPKQRSVLLDLVLHANEPVPVDRLIEDVWGDRAPRTAQHSVQLYVSELRKALGPADGECIVTRPPGYELRIDPESIDAVRFEHLIDEARDRLPTEASEAARLAADALALWHGPALADVGYEEFAQAEIRRLDELRLDAADLLDEARLALGDHRSATADLRKRVAEHPLRESTRGLFMEALAGSGRQAEALRTFQDLRRRLADDLGIQPGSDLARLEERILLQDPALRPSPSDADRPLRNPFKGLRPFHESDAGDFHGRARLVEQIGATILDNRFVAVVGPSGAGKSSVLRAGIVPWAREADRFAAVVMVPGTHPLKALGAAIGAELDRVDATNRLLEAAEAAERELLVLIDQFEELYGSCDDAARRSFVEVILDALASEVPLRFVAALRADFYDRPLLEPEFGPVFTSSVVHVPPMTMDELESAVLGPAEASNLEVESTLVAALVADTIGQPGGLPLFQFSLTDLTNAAADGRLTLESYERSGGVRGALTARAEDAMAGLSDGTEVARQVLLRLVDVGGNGTVTRRRVGAAELLGLGFEAVAVREVLERLGAHRLLTFDRDPATGLPTVELAHDALVTGWDRLSHWIDGARSDLRRRAALAVALTEWEEADRNVDYLPSGEQLQRYEAWRSDGSVALTVEEHAYLDEARRRQDEAEELEHSRLEIESRLRRRARNRLIVAALLAAVVVVAGVIAYLTARPGGPKIAFVSEVPSAASGTYTDLLLQGWERVAREVEFRGEVVVPAAAAIEEIRSLAEADYDLIISGSVFFEGAILTVAEEHPEIQYVLIDSGAAHPSLTSVRFAANEGSFLAGVVAARATESRVVGFVGGMPSPLIDDFRAGFEAGVHDVDPDIDVLAIHVTDQFDGTMAFARPDLGRMAAETLYSLGADVVYHASGASGRGVFAAAADVSEDTGVHRWAIGVDTDEYVVAEPEFRPYILTSMVKRVDMAIEWAIREHARGALEPGAVMFHLVDGALGLSTSGGYIDAWTSQIDDATRRIVAGDIDVPSVPVGVVLPAPDPGVYDVLATMSFEPCEYRGPYEFDAGTIVRLEVANTSDRPAWLGFVPLAEDLTQEEVDALGPEAVGTTLLIYESTGMVVESGGSGAATSPELLPRTYVLACTVDERPHTVGIIHVR
jgi:basic membrane lipoprotein Med (substrate-binding protein (PBP1-ABC) superfamily)/DNA-binding SARP family transcriptional activator